MDYEIPVFLAKLDAPETTGLPMEIAEELPLAQTIVASGRGKTSVSNERYRMALALLRCAIIKSR